MNKYRALYKNIGILTIGQFSTKILVFLLVPLYTNILSTKEYGEYDFIYSTICLMIPIITANISVSAQRFAMDSNANIGQVIKTTKKFYCIGLLCCSALVLLNYVFSVNATIKEYWYFFVFLFAAMAMHMMLVDFAVGLGEIKSVAIAGVLGTFVTVVLNILFLIVLKMGLVGYFIASIISPSIQNIYLLRKVKLVRKKYVDRDDPILEKEMLSYCVPQIANNVSWWINNASDRYVIIYFCDMAVNGIYSVAYKIPSIINIVSGIFGQAWGLSAVKNFCKKDEDGFFTNMYCAYQFVMVMCCSGLILLTKIIAKFMYGKEFYGAWIYVPFLLIATVFGALSGYLGAIYSANKEAKLFARSTAVGAITNIIVNISLVPFIGAIGAAIGTTIAYCVIWLIRLKDAKRFIELRLNRCIDTVTYLLLIVQLLVLIYVQCNIVLYSVQILIILVLVLVNKKNVLVIWKLLKKKENH